MVVRGTRRGGGVKGEDLTVRALEQWKFISYTAGRQPRYFQLLICHLVILYVDILTIMGAS